MSKNLTLPEKLQPATTLTALVTEAMMIARQLMESGGELTPELEAALDVNQESLMRKVDGFVAIEDQFQAQEYYWKRKRDACDVIYKSFSGQIDRLRERVKFVMNEMGVTELKGDEHRYKLGKSVGRLIIEDEAKVPAEFKMIVQLTQVDKERVKAMLKDGFEVPGAKLLEEGRLSVYENRKD